MSVNPDDPDLVLRTSIIVELIAAFHNVRLKDGMTLHEARAADDYESTETQRAVRANDPEARWQDLTDEKLSQFSDVFTFLDDSGRQFYTPAFMVWVLRHLDDEDAGLSWSAMYHIRKNYRPDSSVTERRGRAVCRFLRYLSLRPEHAKDAKAALASGWSRYCSEESLS